MAALTYDLGAVKKQIKKNQARTIGRAVAAGAPIKKSVVSSAPVKKKAKKKSVFSKVASAPKKLAHAQVKLVKAATKTPLIATKKIGKVAVKTVKSKGFKNLAKGAATAAAVYYTGGQSALIAAAKAKAKQRAGLPLTEEDQAAVENAAAYEQVKKVDSETSRDSGGDVAIQENAPSKTTSETIIDAIKAKAKQIGKQEINKLVSSKLQSSGYDQESADTAAEALTAKNAQDYTVDENGDLVVGVAPKSLKKRLKAINPMYALAGVGLIAAIFLLNSKKRR